MRLEQRLEEMRHSETPWLVDEAWSKIRRGWCLGGEPFRKEMDARLDGALESAKRESLSGEGIRRHDEFEAERLMEQGLKALGLQDGELLGLRKNCPEKYAIAWLIRRNTSVRPQWIKDRLDMGKATNFASFLKRMTDGQFGSEPFEKVKNLVS